MMGYSPTLLPKVRSTDLTETAKVIPCTPRVSSFIPGHRCSAQDTNVFTHFGSLGKGKNTKVSDINGFVSCFNCHELLDARDNRVWWIIEKYPRAYYERIIAARDETLAHWVSMGLITGTDWRIV